MNKIYLLIATLGLSATIAFAQTNTFPAFGSVGIGTTNPLTKLHVKGTFAIERSINEHFSTIDNEGNLNYDALNGYNHVWKIAGTERMRITTAGHVGIGTNDPSVQLDVRGQASVYKYNSGADFSAPALLGYSYSDGSGLNIGVTGLSTRENTGTNIGGYFAASGGANNYGLLVPNGNVGIGTTNPTAGLEITPGAGRYAMILNAGDSGSLRWGNGAQGALSWDTGKAMVYSLPGNDLSFGAHGSYDQLYIKFGGNVGIGTTNPTEKLAVNGRIRAKEVIVDTGWSDYVFAKDYKLASLSEVEQHIQQQGHLPGVPSAAEVAEKGVSVGDMQAVLLSKIEELTLHQIAQEKAINSLQNKVESLEAENTQLKAHAK